MFLKETWTCFLRASGWLCYGKICHKCPWFPVFAETCFPGKDLERINRSQKGWVCRPLGLSPVKGPGGHSVPFSSFLPGRRCYPSFFSKFCCAQAWVTADPVLRCGPFLGGRAVATPGRTFLSRAAKKQVVSPGSFCF